MEYGTGNDTKARFVPLWWTAEKIEKASELPSHLGERRDFGLAGSGIYVFEGRHDSRPDGGILYVGKAEVLRERIIQSFRRFAWKDIGGEAGFYADVWDITLRWTTAATAILHDVENLLIVAHSPSFNAQAVRRASETAFDMILLNGGEKGRLLPVVAGQYYDSRVWP